MPVERPGDLETEADGRREKQLSRCFLSQRSGECSIMNFSDTFRATKFVPLSGREAASLKTPRTTLRQPGRWDCAVTGAAHWTSQCFMCKALKICEIFIAG